MIIKSGRKTFDPCKLVFRPPFPFREWAELEKFLQRPWNWERMKKIILRSWHAATVRDDDWNRLILWILHLKCVDHLSEGFALSRSAHEEWSMFFAKNTKSLNARKEIKSSALLSQVPLTPSCTDFASVPKDTKERIFLGRDFFVFHQLHMARLKWVTGQLGQQHSFLTDEISRFGFRLRALGGEKLAPNFTFFSGYAIETDHQSSLSVLVRLRAQRMVNFRSPPEALDEK